MIKYKLRQLLFVVLNIGIMVALFNWGYGYLNNIEPPIAQPMWLSGEPFTGLPNIQQPCMMIIAFDPDCGPCHKMLRWANELYGDQVYVVGMATSSSAKKVQVVVDELGLTFPITYGWKTEQITWQDGSVVGATPFIVVGDIENHYWEWKGAILPEQAREILERYIGEVNDP